MQRAAAAAQVGYGEGASSFALFEEASTTLGMGAGDSVLDADDNTPLLVSSADGEDEGDGGKGKKRSLLSKLVHHGKSSHTSSAVDRPQEMQELHASRDGPATRHRTTESPSPAGV